MLFYSGLQARYRGKENFLHQITVCIFRFGIGHSLKLKSPTPIQDQNSPEATFFKIKKNYH